MPRVITTLYTKKCEVQRLRYWSQHVLFPLPLSSRSAFFERTLRFDCVRPGNDKWDSWELKRCFNKMHSPLLIGGIIMSVRSSAAIMAALEITSVAALWGKCWSRHGEKAATSRQKGQKNLSIFLKSQLRLNPTCIAWWWVAKKNSKTTSYLEVFRVNFPSFLKHFVWLQILNGLLSTL